MMGKSHYWVVSDAVAYMKKFGNEQQQTALQTFELAYGRRESVDTMPPHETAVERLVGFEALHTDKFGDLALSFQGIPGNGKRNVTGLGFHMFTAFNHFINPFPETDVPWESAAGYAYETSSMRGIDSFVVKGISDHLRGLVDVENSLVVDRLRCSWLNDEESWKGNYDQYLSKTKFAPWNVLAGFYYSRLIEDHFEPLEVRGPNQFIVGLQLVGPLVHAAADACAVQHVRSTLGFGHSIWENYLKSKCYNRQINVNARLVSEFLSHEAFSSSLVVETGPLAGCFDMNRFVYLLATLTAQRLQQSTRQDWAQLWHAGDKFWRDYLLGQSMREDAYYLYNMAVAATVHVLVRCYQDLVRREYLSPGDGLKNKEKLPELDLIQEDHPDFPSKKAIDSPPSEAFMEAPFSSAEEALGFSPIGPTDLQQRLGDLYRKLSSPASGKQAVMELFKSVEKQLVDQYEKMARKTGESFCPLRATEKLPLDSELSAHFGTGTFRMPSADECDDPQMFENYMRLSEVHANVAHKIQLTQTIAGLQFTRKKCDAHPALAKRFDSLVKTIESARDAALDSRDDFLAELEASKVQQESKADRAAATEKESVFQKMFSAVQDWIAPVFHVPVTAMATVAATILLLVVLLPRGGQEPFLGLSNEKWDKPQINLMAPKSVKDIQVSPERAEKPRVAVLLYLRDFKKRPPQDEIDSLYRAMKPKQSLTRQIDIVSPSKVNEVMAKARINVEDINAAATALQNELGLNRILILTITAKGDGVLLDSELRDIDSGQVKITKADSPITREEIPRVLSNRVAEQLQAQ
ncbi:MAG: hypothetical protein QG577_736 [Thermodesulfobacteriota bacterium]|nr:hypothetical protein [Thermodesulfobacteriota bacterium]